MCFFLHITSLLSTNTFYLRKLNRTQCFDNLLSLFIHCRVCDHASQIFTWWSCSEIHIVIWWSDNNIPPNSHIFSNVSGYEGLLCLLSLRMALCLWWWQKSDCLSVIGVEHMEACWWQKSLCRNSVIWANNTYFCSSTLHPLDRSSGMLL